MASVDRNICPVCKQAFHHPRKVAMGAKGSDDKPWYKFLNTKYYCDRCNAELALKCKYEKTLWIFLALIVSWFLLGLFYKPLELKQPIPIVLMLIHVAFGWHFRYFAEKSHRSS